MPDLQEPLLKWPGGKRWAAPRIAGIINRVLTGTYIEPFLGGGAVFFQVRPKKALLGDINTDLIATYRTVSQSPDAVLRALRRLRVSEDDYYRVRDREPRTEVTRAAQFLYLNRTAFGGIYRVNRDGRFNVPYGGGQRTPALLWERALLHRAAKVLAHAKLIQADFQVLMSQAAKGDVVYCDPTYTVAHDSNGFVRYNERNFSWADQERLAQAALAAAQRGATVVVSNAHHPSIEALYRGAIAFSLRRNSTISRDAAKRRAVSEYLFVLG